MDPYTRWAQLVVHGAACPSDPRTLALWSAHVGISESTLRSRCAASGVHARDARDFTRLLRLVLLPQQGELAWDPARHLESRDPRTIHRLLLAGGLPAAAPPSHPSPRPTVETFLQHQKLLHPAAVAAVRHALTSAPIPTSPS